MEEDGGNAQPDFGKSVNPISTKGGADHAHQIILAPPDSRPADSPEFHMIGPKSFKITLLLGRNDVFIKSFWFLLTFKYSKNARHFD